VIKVMFVDDRPEEVLNQWQIAIDQMPASSSEFYLLPVEIFDTEEKTLKLALHHKPDLIFVGFGLSSKVSTGADIIKLLHKHEFAGLVVANSGGSVYQFTRKGVLPESSVNRSPEKLRECLNDYMIFQADNKA
jgi:hypothetical protein